MTPRDDEQRTIAPDGRPRSEQPPWRRDFPIERPREQEVMRRDFTKFMVLTSLAFVVGQVWIGVQNWLRRRKGELPIRDVAKLKDIPVGGAVTFHYPGDHDPCLLLRPETNTFLAYHQKCTHLSCAVVPELDRGRLHCPCHQGSFDLASGRPLAGPPRRPLPRILLEVRGDVIYATGMEVRTV